MKIKILTLSLLYFFVFFTKNINAQTTVNFSYTGNIQNWIVPCGITSATIYASGAGGNNNGSGAPGGSGATVIGICTVTPGENLSIVVGEYGGGGGGGGGTFVYDSNSLNLLVIGGGGGGGANPTYSWGGAGSGGDGGIDVLSNAATNGFGGSGCGAGGTNGNGGIAGSSALDIILLDTNYGGGGGAGWVSNGGSLGGSYPIQGGNDRANFFAGYVVAGSGGIISGYGGGGAGNQNGGGGGGGGYNGGGGGNASDDGGATTESGGGGGGGSYLNGILINAVADHVFNGYVSISYSSPSSLTIGSLIINQNVSCFGGDDGSTSVSPNGGGSPYTYEWSDANSQTTATASNLSAGTYTVTVTDNCNSSATAAATITEPAELSITPNSGIGSASVNVSGGTQPYTYLWEPGGATTSAISGLTAGSYTCTVTEASGCGSTTTTINVTPTGIQNISNPAALSIYPNPSNGKFTIQFPVAIGQISLEVYNLLGQKVYSNSTLNIQHSTFNIDLSSQANGVYFYRATAENGELIGQGKLIIQK